MWLMALLPPFFCALIELYLCLPQRSRLAVSASKMTSVASVGNSEPEDSLQKTVLCVFRERRRPVTFNASADEKTEKKNLFDAVKASFSDVLSSGEGTSNPGSYFLQTESSEWGPIDITGFVEDRATVHLCYSTNVSIE